MTTLHRNVIVGDRNVTQTLTLLAIVGDDVSVGWELPQDNLQQLLGTLVTLLDAVDKGAVIPLHNTHTSSQRCRHTSAQHTHIVIKVPSYLCTTHTHTHIVTKVPSYLCTTHTNIVTKLLLHLCTTHTHTVTPLDAADEDAVIPLHNTHPHCHTHVSAQYTPVLSHSLMQLTKVLLHFKNKHSPTLSHSLMQLTKVPSYACITPIHTQFQANGQTSSMALSASSIT